MMLEKSRVQGRGGGRRKSLAGSFFTEVEANEGMGHGFFHLLKPVGFKGNRFHCWTYSFFFSSRGLKQMAGLVCRVVFLRGIERKGPAILSSPFVE